MPHGMFFQRAAEAGLANGALKMAATYDPAELDRLEVKVQGAIPDRAEARKWYERARDARGAGSGGSAGPHRRQLTAPADLPVTSAEAIFQSP